MVSGAAIVGRDGGKPVVAGPVIGVDLSGSGFEGPRKPGGGGLAGVVAGGGVGVGRGARGTDDGGGLKRRRVSLVGDDGMSVLACIAAEFGLFGFNSKSL
ncbi:hypothetical protein FF2_045996 [Malus domestica]